MVRTRVGYAGGTKHNPTYHSLGDHTETLQMDFDPQQISYRKLLEVFWASHPCRPAWSRQYASIIFYFNEEQRRVAEETKAEVQRKRGQVYAEIVAAAPFYLAEDYHQKYYLQQDGPLMREFRAMYPNTKAFVNSTAAARANAVEGGFHCSDEVLGRLGLSEAGLSRLRGQVRQQ